MSLLGPNGRPVGEYMAGKAGITNKKAPPPKTGEAFGNWAGREFAYTELPGGGVVQFDLTKLTTADFRNMRDHYQVNASLAVLSFFQHQSDWHIECENEKIAAHVEENLRRIWTQLNRSLSTANWAGHSPNVLQWENDINGRTVQLDKIKDLAPEECEINWKLVDGWAPPDRTPPKFKVYDGIKQFGQPGWPIPVENSLWYPMLMEHGDHYGRKLLRPAFQSWFFSILVHLFANRYYERFGEPTPVGRAPFDEETSPDGTTTVRGNVYMAQQIQQLRSRSIVVLPNDKSQVGSNGSMEYDYDLEYLESQMRGADFERYMTRLDEEISIATFTPILLLRTADVGSYNLGQGHERIYQMMINAMNADRKMYIDKYIIRKMINYNFGVNAPNAYISFRKMGNTDAAMLKEVIVALINRGSAKIDLNELGQAVGMTLTEVDGTLQPPPTPEDGQDAPDPATDDADASNTAANRRESFAVAKEIGDRVRGQVEASFRVNDWSRPLNMGFKRKMEKALASDGYSRSPIAATNEMYGNLDHWLGDVTSSMKPSEFSGPDEFMAMFENVLNHEIANASS